MESYSLSRDWKLALTVTENAVWVYLDGCRVTGMRGWYRRLSSRRACRWIFFRFEDWGDLAEVLVPLKCSRLG